MGNALQKFGFAMFCWGLIPCLLGFGVKGVRGKSVASSAQSRYGNVGRDSGFSLLQSMGMTGIFIALIILGMLIIALGDYLKGIGL